MTTTAETWIWKLTAPDGFRLEMEFDDEAAQQARTAMLALATTVTIGNTPTVAAASYLFVRDSDYVAATQADQAAKNAVQNPVQQVAELARTERQR